MAQQRICNASFPRSSRGLTSILKVPSLSVWVVAVVTLYFPARKQESRNAMGSYQHVKKTIRGRREWLDQFKNNPCERCGFMFPACAMDFHHVDPSTKWFSLSTGVFRHSKESMLLEIQKCTLLCACCHRITENELRLKRASGTDT
jgi:hypothetical protein